MKDDKAGRVISTSQLLAADRGVNVRLLLDDIFISASDDKLFLINEHSNIEVRLLNPASRRGFSATNFLFDFRPANRRMHNKSFSVDNAVSIVGGRNIGGKYFELKDNATFVDFDVFAIGPVVAKISESFDDFGNHSRAVPIDIVPQPIKSVSLESYRDTYR